MIDGALLQHNLNPRTTTGDRARPAAAFRRQTASQEGSTMPRQGSRAISPRQRAEAIFSLPPQICQDMICDKPDSGTTAQSAAIGPLLLKSAADAELLHKTRAVLFFGHLALLLGHLPARKQGEGGRVTAASPTSFLDILQFLTPILRFSGCEIFSESRSGIFSEAVLKPFLPPRFIPGNLTWE